MEIRCDFYGKGHCYDHWIPTSTSCQNIFNTSAPDWENWLAFSYLDQVGANMNLPIIIAIIVAIVGCVGFGVHHHLDAKAQKLSKGSEEERRLAGELRDISSQIDQGRYLYH